MFNHRRSSKHYLTGRTDGELRVVAGERVRVGEQVHSSFVTSCNPHTCNL